MLTFKSFKVYKTFRRKKKTRENVEIKQNI